MGRHALSAPDGADPLERPIRATGGVGSERGSSSQDEGVVEQVRDSRIALTPSSIETLEGSVSIVAQRVGFSNWVDKCVPMPVD